MSVQFTAPRPDIRLQRRQWLIRATLGSLALGGSPAAQALAQPQGKVVLSITGQIGRLNATDRADFDMAMLDALPQAAFSSRTPWFKAVKRFSGPLLRDVLAQAEARGSSLQAVALNDYKVDIPFQDAQRWPMVLATRLDDQRMTVRNKGPLFIVYPYDDDAELRSERYYTRSAWQLRRLVVH